MRKTIIVTDLDGSLLHPRTYSFDEALPALALIEEKKIPLVLCSSKTRAEMELYRRRLRNRDPFIVENGGGVFAPREYFSHLAAGEAEYVVAAAGSPYSKIREEFVRLRDRLLTPVKGFGDMTVEEIAGLTGLPSDEAALARQRDFAEPFLFERGVDGRFLKAIEEQGLRWTQGKLYCIMGDHDKGRAVRLLKQWYEREQGDTLTIGIGDGYNDLPLLEAVDRPVLIQKEDGTYEPRVDVPGLVKAKGIGPAGWNSAVLELLQC